MERHQLDIAVIGAGIVGLATALALTERFPGAHLSVLEKESGVARHQTGHNSGVIHAGIYYAPGSLKARLCIEGVLALERFCDEQGVPYQRCGKVIVATEERELPALDELLRRGVANGVPGLRRISIDELPQIEPQAAGIAALYSPNTGIVSYAAVARAMRDVLERRGVEVRTGDGVAGLRVEGAGVRISTTRGEIIAEHAINCAGLHADRVARLAGVEPELRIVPFRGEYYVLRPDRTSLVRGLIYPVPDPALPFLGVHFTRTIDGGVEAGPNAVLAFSREGYLRRSVKVQDVAEMATYPGLRRLVRRWWRHGAYEYARSLAKPLFVASLRRLVPEIRGTDLVRGGAGVRAQAVAPDGRLIDDFVIVDTPGMTHVLNAPSPAATASLAIGKYICEGVDFSLTH